MSEIIMAQWDGKAFHPYSDDDRENSATYKTNQIVKLVVSGTNKVPSVRQLNTYWSACAMYSDNTDDKRNFRDRRMVSQQLKVALNFIDLNRSFVDKHGTFHPHYMSISFDNLKQIERSKFIDRAFEQIAEWMGVDVDTVVREAKNQCKRW